MKTIKMKDILKLYKKCDANPNMDEKNIRRNINTGTLDNRLNTGQNKQNVFSSQFVSNCAKEK